MLTVNYTEFKSRLKVFLDGVEDDHETLIINRNNGKGVVLLSLDKYNSIIENLYLLSSKKNADRLYESMEQLKTGKIIHPKLDF